MPSIHIHAGPIRVDIIKPRALTRHRAADGCGCEACTRDAEEITAEDYEQLMEELLAFLAEKASSTSDGEWREEDHPRAANGQFGHGGGSANGPQEGEGGLGPKPTSTTAKVAKHAVHELLSSGHPWTIEELAKITGHTNTKTLAAWLSMFKNAKLAGPKGALNIVKLPDGRYQVVKADGKPAPPVAVPKPEAPKEQPKTNPTPPPVVRARNPTPTPPVAPPGGAKPVPGAVAWTPAKNAKEASARAIANNLVDHADFGRLDPSVIDAHMSSLTDHLKEFPELRKNQQWAGSIQAYKQHAKTFKSEKITAWVDRYWPGLKDRDPERYEAYVKAYQAKAARKVKVSEKTWAFSTSAAHPGGSGISINDEYGRRGAEVPGTFGREVTGTLKLERGLKASVATGFHPPGCDTVKSIADHEYGHQLDNLLGLSGHPTIIALRNNSSNGAMVSRYAATNMAEFIAEAWAEAKNNPNPRAFARGVAEVIRSEYAKKFGRSAARSGQPATAAT